MAGGEGSAQMLFVAEFEVVEVGAGLGGGVFQGGADEDAAAEDVELQVVGVAGAAVAGGGFGDVGVAFALGAAGEQALAAGEQEAVFVIARCGCRGGACCGVGANGGGVFGLLGVQRL